MTDPRDISRSERFWLVAGAIPFLLSIALLGYAINRQVMVAFGIGWPILQVIGYAGALRIAKGDLAHPLVKNQVVLHYLALVLLIAVFVRAT